MNKSKLFEILIKELELPESAYLKAEDRYKDLGVFFGREESTLLRFSPRFRPQGSFRIGTAVKPISTSDPYDLDITCLLEENILETDISQSDFKTLIKIELEKYRLARNIKKKIENKQRCLRLNYSGDIDFHIDIVPSLPIEEDLTKNIKLRLIQESLLEQNHAEQVAKFTIGITDEEHNKFKTVPSNWKLSNPEGYALWFIEQMNKNKLLQEGLIINRKMSIEDIPVFQWDSPLQQAIKIFKRHRDIQYIDTNGDSKPISIIISTLAAHVYEGENNLKETMKNLPKKMKHYLKSKGSKLPNPVRPGEYFTDKWDKAEGKELKLETNFWYWIDSLIKDLTEIVEVKNTSDLTVLLEGRFNVKKSNNDFEDIFDSTIITSSPAVISLGTSSPKPWCDD